MTPTVRSVAVNGAEIPDYACVSLSSRADGNADRYALTRLVSQHEAGEMASAYKTKARNISKAAKDNKKELGKLRKKTKQLARLLAHIKPEAAQIKI